ncbi:hypothetical protein [Kocuria flava]|uniref:hypothetical protein n=1 Tax=Kocuria flava TaxID=446860 RepID=UPI0027E33377|nr:hypothetical protein [Kocuria flava]
MSSVRTWGWALLAAALLTLWLLPIPGGSKLWLLAVLAFAGVFTLLEAGGRDRLLAGAMVALLVVYLGLSLHRAVLLLGAGGWIATGFGLALIALPAVGAWAMVREIAFGVRTERLARALEAEGGLPADDLPRTPGGRIERGAADARFAEERARTEAAPGTGAAGTGSPWPTPPRGTAPAPARPCATPWPCPGAGPPATSSPPARRAEPVAPTGTPAAPARPRRGAGARAEAVRWHP